MMLAPTLVLSPYLRSIKVETANGTEFVVDDGIRGRIELDAPMQAVVRAMWNPAQLHPELFRAFTKFGADVIHAAVERLKEEHIVFDSQRECDQHLDGMLEGARGSVPFVDQVELTNICPFKCQFCPRGVDGKMKRATGKMEFALFERLLDQLRSDQPKYRAFELHHLGESLVHPEVDRFIAAAAARGLPTELSCNPAVLKPELMKRVLDAGIRRLVISSDGMDNETSIAIRGPAARYDRAEKHLDALFAYAAGMANPPRIVVQMIDLSRNAHQREAFLARWGSSKLPFVEAYIKDLDGPDPDTGKSGATPPSYLCGYPWRSVVVLWDGRVVPCCLDSDAALVLGDLTTQTLEEIWNGPAAVKLRDDLRKNEVACGSLCDGCGWRREVYATQMHRRHPDRAKTEPLYW